MHLQIWRGMIFRSKQVRGSDFSGPSRDSPLEKNNVSEKNVEMGRCVCGRGGRSEVEVGVGPGDNSGDVQLVFVSV